MLSPVPNLLRRALIISLAAGLAALSTAGAVSPAAALDVSLRSPAESSATVVLLSGRIERGDAGRIQSFIARLPRTQPVAVELNSTGGLIDEALALGRYFHANNVRAYVIGEGRQCLSACALAFLGGTDGGAAFRVKGARASIGFHGFRRNVPDKEFTVADMHQAIADTQKVTLMIVDYLSEIGADIEFLSMMLEAPSTSMHYLTNEKAITIGVHVLHETTGQLIPPTSKAMR